MNGALKVGATFLALAALTGCVLAPATPTATPAAQVRTKPPTRQATAGDISVAYRVYGAGEPLLLIMGYASTMDTWNPDLIAPLAEHYQVIVFDNRGMGQTTAGSRPFSIEQFAEDTAAFLDALRLPRAHVLAWSMGTNIALEFALRHPDKVNRLILYAGNAGGAQAIPPSPAVLAQLTDTSGTPEEQGRRLMGLLAPGEWLAQNGRYLGEIFSGPQETSEPANIGKQAAAIAAWRGAFERLPALRPPTLLITGSEDVITPPANSVQMAGVIPNAWLVQLRGGGHGAQYQYPALMARIAGDFLAAP